jgi:osmotically-inducible protein OsmY
MIMLQNDDVEARVLNALHWDLAVPPHRVKVEVENGWVTMSGTVDRYYQRTCAESDARRVPGVLGVNNHIRLRRRTRSKGPLPASDLRQPSPLGLYFHE